jgi:DNA-binding transcriptional regulator YhcF (GntR family)
MSDLRTEIADVLRGRIIRGLQAGSISPGDRLPSARELEAEFGVDHRQVLDAYRQLVAEELVELRPRGGIYVSAAGFGGRFPLPSSAWLTGVLLEGLNREIPLPELHDWLRRAVETRRLRGVAVHSTEDQIAGLCREMCDDYGLEASGVHVTELERAELPADVRYADVLVTTPVHEATVRAVAERLGIKAIVTDVRMDLIGGEWRLLLRRPVYVVVRDENFTETLARYFTGVPGAGNIRMLLAGRDDLAAIPDDAPVYVTRGARDVIGDRPIAGRLLPTARIFSAESSRELVRFIVTANLAALAGARR